MSFFNQLQKAFGFSYDDENPENELSVPAPAQAPPVMAATNIDEKPQHTEQTPAPEEAPGNDNTPNDHPTQEKGTHDTSIIFRAVVELLNSELPEFYRKNLNEPAQRQYLMERIGADIKAHIAAIEADARQHTSIVADRDRDKLRATVADQKSRLTAMQDKLTLETEKALSAERQKRALNGRIQDLEAKAASLDAEKEQFQMEIRQLQNKLRLADTKLQYGAQHDPQAILNLQKEAEEARGQLAAMRQELDTQLNLNATLTAETQALKAQNVDNKKLTELVKELKHLLDELDDKNEALEQQNQTLKKQVDALQQHNDTLLKQHDGLKQKMETLAQENAELQNRVSTLSRPEPQPAKNSPARQQPQPTQPTQPSELDNIDWLADSDDYPNPDLITTPNNPDSDTPLPHSGPTQMSLF